MEGAFSESPAKFNQYEYYSSIHQFEWERVFAFPPFYHPPPVSSAAALATRSPSGLLPKKP
jgi:hypothetical protein